MVTEYDAITGRILGTYSGWAVSDFPPGTSVIEGLPLHREQYVSGGRFVDRPASPVSMVGGTLVGVPAGAVVTIEGVEYIADDSEIEFEFAFPGRYVIRVSCWPFLDFETVYEN